MEKNENKRHCFELAHILKEYGEQYNKQYAQSGTKPCVSYLTKENYVLSFILNQLS